MMIYLVYMEASDHPSRDQLYSLCNTRPLADREAARVEKVTHSRTFVNEMPLLEDQDISEGITYKMVQAGFEAYYNHPIPQDSISMKRALHDVYVAMAKAKETK